MLKIIRSVCLGCCVVLPLALSAAPQQPDNTRTNAKSHPTADQQKNNRGDRELAAKIRKSVIADKALSTYAHNVKIIVQQGVVTLKGPVRSQEESQSIQAKAQQLTDAASVHNEMTVASK